MRTLTAARLVRTLLIAIGVGLVAVAAGLLFGTEHISLTTALSDPRSTDATILYVTRLPRVLLALAVGAALAPAGVTFQALLGNPLADPYVLGVSGGAATAGAIAIALGLDAGHLGDWALPAAAFGGALGAIALVFVLGRVRGRLVPHVALLAGVVVNALASAMIVAVRLLVAPGAEHDALSWLTGELTPLPFSRLAALAVYVLLGNLWLWRWASSMNALVAGAESAHALGVHVDRVRRHVFLAASLLVGAAVAFAGPIGFVGILVPHVLRRFIGADHRVLLPVSLLGGAVFLVLSDLLARLSYSLFHTEPTVGVVTALVGAPFFLVALRRGANRPW